MTVALDALVGRTAATRTSAGSGPGIGDAVVELARDEVAFAYENVGFFGPHLDRAGLRPTDISDPAAMRRVPLTDKTHYRSNFPAGVLARGAKLSDQFILRSHSSGTSGERLTTVATTYDLAERMRTTIGVHPGMTERLLAYRRQRLCRYAAPNCSDVECASPHTTMAGRILRDGTLVLPVGHDLLATPPSMIDQAIEEIGVYRPHWFYTDPTHMAFLVRECRRRGLDPPSCGALLLTYTMATQVARRQIGHAFPGRVHPEVVSMSELGWILAECPEGRAHLNTRSFYMELLVGSRPAQPGELGELVVTSLGDRLLPHVRYRTGDVYRWLDAPCPCGHAFPVVRHEGRLSHLVLVDGRVRTTPKEVDDVVASDWIDVYRLHQHDEERAELAVIANRQSTQADLVELEERLAAAVKLPYLTIAVTDYIPGERSGKFLSCTSAVAERSTS